MPVREQGIVRDGFDESDAAANIRSLCVSQVLSLRLHSDHLRRGRSICVVGGAAKNPFLMQLVADVFQLEAYNIDHADLAAPLGCAISGARRILDLSYEDAAHRYVQRDEASARAPDLDASSRVSRLLERYRRLEEGRGS